MGGKGKLEEYLNKVFLTNLLPTIESWLNYGSSDKEETQKAILRFTLGHLVANLEGEESPVNPEEVYLSPPLDRSLKTGSIVRCKGEKTLHVIVTPACDLVIRSDYQPKSDVVVIAEIIPQNVVFAQPNTSSTQKKRLKCNNYVKYYHWLPKCSAFDGGFVDFRRLRTVKWKEFNSLFDRIEVRVAPVFLKDFVSRFSTFYARQGQPTLDLSYE